MVIPNDNFMASRWENKDNKVGLVHHFNNLDRLIQVLNLLLYPVTARVVLDYLKPLLSGDSEVLLTLVRWNHLDGGRIRWDVSLHDLADSFLVDKALDSLDNLSGWCMSVLWHRTHLLSLRKRHTCDCLINDLSLVLLLCGRRWKYDWRLPFSSSLFLDLLLSMLLWRSAWLLLCFYHDI